MKEILNGRSVILRAPCGSGKTEAAFLPFVAGRRGILPSKLIYALPTRALVEDVSDRIRACLTNVDPSVTVACHHGANAADPFFNSNIVVTTLDQLVGAYCCTPLSLPTYLGNIPGGAATSSMICFDEAHSYDYRLGFQTMLLLIDRALSLGVPFVVMSATLPNAFLDHFREDERVAILEAREEDIPRRRDREVTLSWEGKIPEESDVRNEMKENQRLMVVCNTVGRAQEFFEKLRNSKTPVFLLHSRFLNSDRERIVESMKKCFRGGESACLITTQVCEVGLDISCDTLLTEMAPADALVQRIGRCARTGGKGRVKVFDVNAPYPYDPDVMKATAEYLKRTLNGGALKWEDELRFVDFILRQLFEQVVRDEPRRNLILKRLADAAFEGDRAGIEENVREILSANLTIHDDPHDDPRLLDFDEVMRMPWLSVDIRVLKAELSRSQAQYWRVKFGTDENGKPDISFDGRGEILPSGYYVVSPQYARYEPDTGLVLGSPGQAMKPRFNDQAKTIDPPQRYELESWVDHSLKCLAAFDRLLNEELSGLAMLKSVLQLPPDTVKHLAVSCVALHDLGKLNMKWQKSVGAEKVPLAHSPTRHFQPPPHAAISAVATQSLIEEIAGEHFPGLDEAALLAIAHHHHTRADQAQDYQFISNWRECFKEVQSLLQERYSLFLEPSFVTYIHRPQKLSAQLISFERLKLYTTYTVLARTIRLCDKKSFEESCSAPTGEEGPRRATS